LADTPNAEDLVKNKESSEPGKNRDYPETEVKISTSSTLDVIDEGNVDINGDASLTSGHTNSVPDDQIASKEPSTTANGHNGLSDSEQSDSKLVLQQKTLEGGQPSSSMVSEEAK